MAKSMEDRHGPVSDSSESRRTGRVLLDTSAQGVLNAIEFTARFLGWCVKWSFAAIIFIGVMALAAYYVFTNAVRGGGYVVVPDVVGRPVTQASNILAEKGLEIGDQRSVNNPNVPPYHVILQRPAPNKVVRSGRKVSLTISRGREFQDPPNVVGMQVEDAKGQLESNGLVLGSMARLPHEAPRDTILAQDPAPPDEILAGGEVHLLVSDGPKAKSVFMPDVRGLSLDAAARALEERNIAWAIYTVEAPSAPYDVVLKQDPQSGAQMDENVTARIDVRPAPTTSLPTARRVVTIEYEAPFTSAYPTIRAERVAPSGERILIYPLESDYVDGKPPVYPAGTTYQLHDVVVEEGTTIEFLADGKLHRTFYYGREGDPVVTTFRNLETQSDQRVLTEDLPLVVDTDRSRPRIRTIRP